MARERKHPRRTRRRGRFRFFYKLISLVAVVAAIVTACVIFFRVNEVKVEGNSHYTAQEIIDASEIEMGDNLVTLWTWQINQLVGSKLPYVQRVVVGHTFPDKVTLQVVERTVAATVEGNGRQWLMASDGYLLETTNQNQGIAIVGLEVVDPQAGQPMQVSEADQSKGEAIVPLMEALDQAGKLSQCTQFDCSAASSILVNYGIHQLRFPLHGDYAQMLNLFQAALDSGQVPNEPRVFDFTILDNRVFMQNPKQSDKPEPSQDPDATASDAPDPAASQSPDPEPSASTEPAASASPEPSAAPEA
ncbi:hypothetical protein B5F12_05080 [Pseudoflavonifractor sp. An176]|uniref:FtsQ-type POTRA domain-containing protein n=1 Tax=Pseudoflavonifractor sp. An176 TaxID=1965572 RepID=UPI000B3796B4|nr:FtsQ-type POTRA domain-containing protein [Pseudoflavonifractor sp. An176]OUP64702.1 hypothetical protein B5F12_05080 [Pseudoflavonifractor sp. An176]